MALSRPGTLALAAVLDAPALWSAFVTGELSVSTALLRFLIAVPVAALMLAALRQLTDSYRKPAAPAPIRAVAERLDAGDAPPPPPPQPPA